MRRSPHRAATFGDSLLKTPVSLVPEGDDEGQYADKFRISLLNARLDVAAGRLTPHDEVRRRLGL